MASTYAAGGNGSIQLKGASELARGLKKAGRFLRKKVLPKIGGALKGLAKKALPFVGGALGSFIPIPGVGTAVGSALGSAVSKALEMEFGELESDEAELEIARRVVRIAATTARNASAAAPNAPPDASLRDALLEAIRTHLPAFADNEEALMGEYEDEDEIMEELYHRDESGDR